MTKYIEIIKTTYGMMIGTYIRKKGKRKKNIYKNVFTNKFPRKKLQRNSYY